MTGATAARPHDHPAATGHPINIATVTPVTTAATAGTAHRPRMAGQPTDRTLAPAHLGADAVADVVARLRREMRRGVRIGVPQETVSAAQAEVLHVLTDSPGLRAVVIGERLRLAATTVSTLVGQLLDKHAVVRRPDPDDRRAFALHITDVGVALLQRWHDSNAGVLRDALAQLTERDRTAIERALPALNRLIASMVGERG